MIDQTATGPNGLGDAELIDGIAATEAAVSRSRRQQMRFIREFDLREQWQHDGARHMGQWLAAHLGISVSEGLRRTKAAHALERLPLLAQALEDGVLSFEKVVQLARYLESDTEEQEIRWAQKARLDAIKRRADLANRPTLNDVQALEVSRYLTMWECDEFGSLGIEGRLPAIEGARFKAAIEKAAKDLPVAPDAELDAEPDHEQQCADALVALTVGRAAEGKDPQRATVVVHADLDALIAADRGAEIEDGPVIASEVASRMLCDCKLELNVHDRHGAVVGVGRETRVVPRWLRRLLKRRDGGCTFPGCCLTTFLDAHHIIHWEHGGPTDLDNLTLLCHHHHKLVHEFGWKVVLNDAQVTQWFRPDGSRFEPEKSGARRRRSAGTHPSDRIEPGRSHPAAWPAPASRPEPDRPGRRKMSERLAGVTYPGAAAATSGFG